MISHLLGKYFIDRGSCFAVCTEQSCFWLELYPTLIGWAASKNIAMDALVLCLSQSTQSVMRLLNPTGTWSPRAQQCLAGPGCSTSVPAEMGSTLGAPAVGWGGRTELGQTSG